MLDGTSQWHAELTWDDQQSLMLARLLIHEPRWVVIDELLDAIDRETRTRALEIFSRDLKDAAIIHIGRSNAADPTFTRVLHLIKDPKSRRLVRQKAAETAALPPGIQATASS
jgi:putative ATP-binding cassette transporter